MNYFDDFLDLINAQLRSCRLVIFTGVSGSGKSTAIQWLLNHHVDFKGRPAVHISGGGKKWSVPDCQDSLVVVDDIIDKIELVKIWRVLNQGNQVILASHIHPRWFLFIRTFWETKIFRTDQDHDKIMRYLKAKHVEFTPAAVHSFCNEYGSSYLDLTHILERYPGRSFDRALGKFRKYCRMEQPTMNA